MKKSVVISLSAAAAALVIGFAFGGLANIFQGPAARSRGTIKISGVPGRCVATTDPQLMQGKRNKKVNWKIDDSSKCLPENVEVELRFKNGWPFWFSGTAKGKQEIDRTIQSFAPVRKVYEYKVWAVGPGTEYEMEDPKLEIVE